ncbi:MAG: hypothetical protein IT562_01235 [Alphaproteobacteria bacterium]|nr:hypothetical protein [Alphaproteobacteria bacterium]
MRASRPTSLPVVRLACAAAALASLAGTPPADAREIQLHCKHELATKPTLFVFDSDNRTAYYDDGKLKQGTVSVNESQITFKQVESQPVCHVSQIAGKSGCNDGKQVTEFTTVINRKAGTYLVYCKNIQDDSNNWKPGQNCFPQGPNKGTCDKN